MKNIILAFAYLFSSLSFALPVPEQVEIVQTRPFERLLELFDISPAASPEEISAKAQILWLQKGKERWEFDQRFEPLQSQLYPLFDQMGFFQKITPKSSHYDYALVHGALVGTVETRIQYLCELYDSGVRFDSIVFLTGHRLLQEAEIEKTGCATEREAVEWAYRRSNLPKQIPAIFIDAPMKLRGGVWVRPDTQDTITGWLATKPKPGSCLAISNQPFVRYQDAVFAHFLSKDFTLETVGPAVKNRPSVALVLDTLAKELFWNAK